MIETIIGVLALFCAVRLWRIQAVLCEIRDALAPQAEEPSDECQHPEEWRVDLRSVGEREHWICRGCKHEYIA